MFGRKQRSEIDIRVIPVPMLDNAKMKYYNPTFRDFCLMSSSEMYDSAKYFIEELFIEIDLNGKVLRTKDIWDGDHSIGLACFTAYGAFNLKEAEKRAAEVQMYQQRRN